jgi:hypothetical protein
MLIVRKAETAQACHNTAIRKLRYTAHNVAVILVLATVLLGIIIIMVMIVMTLLLLQLGHDTRTRY